MEEEMELVVPMLQIGQTLMVTDALGTRLMIFLVVHIMALGMMMEWGLLKMHVAIVMEVFVPMLQIGKTLMVTDALGTRLMIFLVVQIGALGLMMEWGLHKMHVAIVNPKNNFYCGIHFDTWITRNARNYNLQNWICKDYLQPFPFQGTDQFCIIMKLRKI